MVLKSASQKKKETPLSKYSQIDSNVVSEKALLCLIQSRSCSGTRHMPNPVRFTVGSFLFDLIRPSYLQQPRNDSFFVLDADDAAITIVADLAPTPLLYPSKI